MIWPILLFLGFFLIGGLIAFLASDSKSSAKDNEVDIDTTNSKGTQTEQGISRVPERSLYLNTTPAMAPMMQQPAMVPMMPQPNVPFDIPDEKKDIKNTQELNSLTSLLKNQEKIKQLEEENDKLSKEVNDINFEKLTWGKLKQKIESSCGLSVANVNISLYKLLETVQELSECPDEQKNRIIGKIKEIKQPSATNQNINIICTGGNPNELAKSITNLKNPAADVDANKTKKDVLIEAMTSILYSEDYVEKIHALEDIIIQLSRRNSDNTMVSKSRISTYPNKSCETLKGVFYNTFGASLQQKVDDFCDSLNIVYELIRKRTIDDQGFDYSGGVTVPDADPFKPLRLTGQFLHATNNAGHIANALSPAIGQHVTAVVRAGNPNNKAFKKIFDEMNRQNTLARQFKEISQFYDDNNNNAIKDKIVDLNNRLFAQFKLLNNDAIDENGKNNITENIKTTIIAILNNASNAKPNEEDSDRKQIYNYLTKIGFKIEHVNGTGTNKDCGEFKKENITDIESSKIFNDKDALKKVSEYCSKKLQIKKNEEEIKKVKKSMLSL